MKNLDKPNEKYSKISDIPNIKPKSSWEPEKIATPLTGS